MGKRRGRNRGEEVEEEGRKERTDWKTTKNNKTTYSCRASLGPFSDFSIRSVPFPSNLSFRNEYSTLPLTFHGGLKVTTRRKCEISLEGAVEALIEIRHGLTRDVSEYRETSTCLPSLSYPILKRDPTINAPQRGTFATGNPSSGKRLAIRWLTKLLEIDARALSLT